MQAKAVGNRLAWLVCGVLIGAGVTWFWPHEPIRADMGDRNEKFGMISTAASAGGGFGPGEAVFILDFLTGRLQGFFLSPRAGGFTQMYYRDVAKDFQLDRKTARGPLSPSMPSSAGRDS
jgi:hypothetical protein